MNPDVSVIVPVYNVERFFERCLVSLFEQSLDNIEYIFVDDCSPDGSMEVLERVLKRYPERQNRVRIITHERNMGSGASRRDGMKAARGEYVIHCDSDDWLETDMYWKMLELARSESADMVFCGVALEYGKKTRVETFRGSNDDKDGIKDLKLGVLYSSLANKLVRRSLYVDNDIYPFEGVNNWEDLGVMVRLRNLSRKTVTMPDAFYHYNRCNENSLVSVPRLSTIDEQLWCASLVENYFEKHGMAEEYYLPLQCIKFMAKERLLLEPTLRNIMRWETIFPETHRHIWKYKNLSRNLRFEYWLAAHFSPRLACALIDFKTHIKQQTRKL